MNNTLKYGRIDPQKVKAYLGSRGWRLQFQGRSQHAIWTLKEFEILLLSNVKVLGYSSLMQLLVQTLMISEDRTESQVLRDLGYELFELSRDYSKAFELIKRGDRLSCLVDYEDFRDPAIARLIGKDILIGVRGIGYIDLCDDQLESDGVFVEECDRLDVQFFIPVED